MGGTYKILPNLRSTLAYGAQFSDDGTDYARLNASANEKFNKHGSTLSIRQLNQLI